MNKKELGQEVVMADRIDELIKRYGGLRATARALKLDAGYLSRLRSGNKMNPSTATLAILGLRRKGSFERR